ncbi:hypothetical protein CEXT_35431 [Caerostris extrusa]|uniref:Uncharacterized protein n=1 Tax=Caerostris extrusa TaxID=172846 RepID=A0AAV4UHB4_CAEEX|nr:hypothetical protein CEXT_35431 [Caerostris extrusa]
MLSVSERVEMEEVPQERGGIFAVCLVKSRPLSIAGDRKDDTQHHTIEASMYARLAFVYVEQHSAIIKGIALCNEQ